MEPLNDSVAVAEAETGKPPAKPDRVTLGKTEADKVEAWLAQINATSKGFLSLTKSDVVNFLIRSHRDELKSRELTQIRSDHYDPVRHINWIAPQLKRALTSGDIARVSELQAEIRRVELSATKVAGHQGAAAATSGARPTRTRKKAKTELTDDPATETLSS